MDELVDAERADTLPSTGAITLDAIRAAQAVFERRVREAAETIDGLPFDDIVIAHNVTRAQLEQVPREWLSGIKTTLRGDGTLVIRKLASQQHSRACNQLLTQLLAHAQTNGFQTAMELPLILPDGSTVIPDAQLYMEAEDTDGSNIALVLFEVEVRHRDMPEILATARRYLAQFPTVVRVVFFKFYPPRNPALNDHRRLSIPALAVVIERTATVHEIGISRIVSFGNADIQGAVLGNFFGQPDDVPAGVRLPAPWLPPHFDLDTLVPQLEDVRARHPHALLDVDMPAPWRTIHVDLVEFFVTALRGWNQDHRGAAAAAHVHQLLVAAEAS